MRNMLDLQRDTKLLAEIVRDLDQDVRGGIELDDALECLAVMEEANRDLAGARRYLMDLLGGMMEQKRRTVIGAGTFERHARREGTTKCMDEEGLWRSVLDVRMVDPDTGEVTPQSEIIRMAYGAQSKETGLIRLTGSSPSKVEAVGLDAEMFFEKADRVGWTIQVHQ